MDVGVFRRDLGAALAQGFLYDAQILGLLIEVRAAAVAEEVAGVAGLLESCLSECLVDDVADADARDAPLRVVVRAGDDGRREAALGRDGTARLDVCAQDTEGLLTGVDDARVSLTADLDAPALPVDVLVGEAHDLDDTQSLDPHEVDDEEVAQAAQLVLVGSESLADLLDLIDGEVLIVLVEVLRIAQLEIGAGVLGDEGEALGDLVKGADRRSLDHESGGTVAARPHLLHVDTNLVVVHVVQRVQPLLHAPVEKEADGELVCVARVRRRGAARDIARKVLVEMRDKVLWRNGVLTCADGRRIHAAHSCRRIIPIPRGNAHLLRAAAAVCAISCQKVTLFRFRLLKNYSMKRCN